jgi:uncharacterized membrane-anchored protein YjiN (DUF445 family)
MFWHTWNKADKTLLAAAAIFMFAVCLRLSYPGNIVSQGFLFCAEAALVGGVADWFAVTALFRKPLGFPWHTAILPRRRESFIRASTQMIQTEFFSKRSLFRMVHKFDFQQMLASGLQEEGIRQMLVKQLLHYARHLAAGCDTERQAAALSAELRKHWQELPLPELLSAMGQWLRHSGRDQEIVARVSGCLQERAARPEFREGIEQFLENQQKKKAAGGWGMLLLGLAQATDIVNSTEASQLIQKQILEVLSEAAGKDTKLQTDILALLYREGDRLAAEPAFVQMAETMRADLLAALPLENALQHCLESLQQHFLQGEDAAAQALRRGCEDLLADEVSRLAASLASGPVLQKEIDRFLYDMAARTALAAQTMIGGIVRNVLSRMTDEQLNHLVYDKAEPDLLWIRMNGSIVGSAVGLCLFLLLHVFA